MGIVNGEDFQIVYSDTPGIIEPHYKLQEYMMRYVKSAFDDADILLFVTDVKESSNKNQQYIELLKNTKSPLFILINKIDLSNQETVEELVEFWGTMIPHANILPISAKTKINIDLLFNKIIEHLPLSPPYFPKDQLTDRSERFFVAEIIREKILITYRQEIPYSVEVQVNEFKEGASIIKINATIFVMKRSQKAIIIGKQGQALKKTGTEARKDIEAFLDKKVYLELYVKVSKDWKYRTRSLRDFGY
jgi:GTP-binding protein Era